jgi:hypothetical protein
MTTETLPKPKRRRKWGWFFIFAFLLQALFFIPIIGHWIGEAQSERGSAEVWARTDSGRSGLALMNARRLESNATTLTIVTLIFSAGTLTGAVLGFRRRK